MWNLKNKIALITGGTKGIGKATVEEFLKLGATVIFTARNKEQIQEYEKTLRARSLPAYGIKCDVSSANEIENLKNFIITNFNRLDILVNNAGINIRKKASEYTAEEYEKIISINLTAAFTLSRIFYNHLKSSGAASIVNVASVAATQDVKSGTPYAMAKAALLQQTRSLASEWAMDKIRVNAVSPWYTDTPLVRSVFEDEPRMAKIIERTPMQRVAQPEEIASAITFFAMDKASYITGQNLIIDGGLSANAL